MMKKIKRLARLLAFICLIFLAGIGVGISGGMPITFSKNRKESEQENIELLEAESDPSDAIDNQIKN